MIMKSSSYFFFSTVAEPFSFNNQFQTSVDQLLSSLIPETPCSCILGDEIPFVLCDARLAVEYNLLKTFYALFFHMDPAKLSTKNLYFFYFWISG